MPEFSCSGVQHMGTHLPCPREAPALQSRSPAGLVTGLPPGLAAGHHLVPPLVARPSPQAHPTPT